MSSLSIGKMSGGDLNFVCARKHVLNSNDVSQNATLQFHHHCMIFFLSLNTE